MKSRLALAALFFSVAACASAQPYPSKPVQLIVPYTAGGGADVVMRAIAQRLADVWAKNVVVDNRAWASGRTRAVNRVPACGM